MMILVIPIDIITWRKKRDIPEPRFFPKQNHFQFGRIYPIRNMGAKAVESHSSLTAFIWLMCMCPIQRGIFPVCPTGTIPGILILRTMSSSFANQASGALRGFECGPSEKSTWPTRKPIEPVPGLPMRNGKAFQIF